LVSGYQPERVQAGIYLLSYTLLASLPLLVGIFFVYNSLGSLCLFLLCGDNSLVGGLLTRQPPIRREKYQCCIDTVSSPDDGHIVARNM